MNTLTIILIIALSLVVVYFILSSLVPTLADLIIKFIIKILTWLWIFVRWIFTLPIKLLKKIRNK